MAAFVNPRKPFLFTPCSVPSVSILERFDGNLLFWHVFHALSLNLSFFASGILIAFAFYTGKDCGKI